MVERAAESYSYLETPNEMRCLSSKEYCRGQYIRKIVSGKLLAYPPPGKGQMGKSIKVDAVDVFVGQREGVGNQYNDRCGICQSSRNKEIF